jgi:hypothetical protein
MHDWNRSRIGSNRPGATRQDAQLEVRDMGMSTIQIPPGAADETGIEPRVSSNLPASIRHTAESCAVALAWLPLEREPR